MAVVFVTHIGCNRYIPLNYLIHYFGVVVVLLFPPQKRPVAAEVQIVNALGMFVLYLRIIDAKQIYGCDIDDGLVPLVAAVVTSVCYIFSDRLAKLATLTPL